MKKIVAFLAAALLFVAAPKVSAQGVYDGPEPGESILSVRAGFVNIVGGNVAYDYSLAQVWKGSFTIGGQAGYMWHGAWDHSIDVKVRTTYRFSVVVPEWEVYGGVGLGCGIGLDLNPKHANNVAAWFSGAFILGTTYYFNEIIGANLEFDFGNWGQSWVNLGIQMKL